MYHLISIFFRNNKNVFVVTRYCLVITRSFLVNTLYFLVRMKQLTHYNKIFSRYFKICSRKWDKIWMALFVFRGGGGTVDKKRMFNSNYLICWTLKCSYFTKMRKFAKEKKTRSGLSYIWEFTSMNLLF